MMMGIFALSHAIVAFTLALVTVLLASGRKNRAFGIYAFAFGFLGVSFIMFALAGDEPSLFSSYLASLMLGLSQVFFSWGLREYDENPRAWPFRFFLYLAIYAAALLVFAFPLCSPHASKVVVASFVAINALEYLLTLIRGFSWLSRKTQLKASIIQSALVLYEAVVIFFFVASFRSDWPFGDPDNLVSVLIAVSMVFTLLRMYVIVMLDTARLLHEMEMKKAAFENLALKDELTGLLNRHTLERSLENEMQRQDRYRSPLSLVMLDVDHFKRVNDVFGHDVGDRVLVEVARRISGGIRSTDLLFRWGGEELLILAPNTDLSGAARLAENLRSALSGAEFEGVGTVSASFGVAERIVGEPRDECFRRVDQAMYRAKTNGRNRVETWASEETRVPAMVRIEWLREWDSGVESIDREHREMIALGNNLLNLSLTDAPIPRLLSDLDALLSNIRQHFANEEKILAASGYPDLNAHHALHEALLVDAGLLRESFVAGKVDPSLLFNLVIEKIVLDHMISADSDFFPHIKK